MFATGYLYLVTVRSPTMRMICDMAVALYMAMRDHVFVALSSVRNRVHHRLLIASSIWLAAANNTTNRDRLQTRRAIVGSAVIAVNTVSS